MYHTFFLSCAVAVRWLGKDFKFAVVAFLAFFRQRKKKVEKFQLGPRFQSSVISKRCRAYREKKNSYIIAGHKNLGRNFWESNSRTNKASPKWPWPWKEGSLKLVLFLCMTHINCVCVQVLCYSDYWNIINLEIDPMWRTFIEKSATNHT